MSQQDPLPTPSSPPTAAALGHRAAGGAAWAFGQTVASKIIGVTAQFAIAQILDQRAIGTAYQAFAIMAFPTVLLRFGLLEILVQQQKRFRRLATAAFWISALSGFLVTAIGLLCALVVGYQRMKNLAPGSHEDPWLVSKLVVVVALGNSFDGFATLPQVKLRIQLEFRRINRIAFFSNLISALLTLVFLLLGMGPMSIILPRTLAKIYELFAVWTSAPVKVRLAPDFLRWSPLLRNGAILTFAYFCGQMLQIGDNISVAYFKGDYALGIYAVAFNLSTQSLQLLVVSLWPTLMSVLSKLAAEPARQAEAFMRSNQMLLLILTPCCFLQAAVALPFLHLLFRTKWDAAIPVLQALSVAMVFGALVGNVVTFMLAQGRFRLQLLWQLCSGVLFFTAMILAAVFGSVVTVGVAECLFLAIAAPIGIYIVVRPARIGVGRIIALFLRPITGSTLACGLPMAAMYLGIVLPNGWIPVSHFWAALPPGAVDLLQCAAITVAALSLYALFTFKMQRESLKIVMIYASPVIERLRRHRFAERAVRYIEKFT